MWNSCTFFLMHRGNGLKNSSSFLWSWSSASKFMRLQVSILFSAQINEKTTAAYGEALAAKTSCCSVLPVFSSTQLSSESFFYVKISIVGGNCPMCHTLSLRFHGEHKDVAERHSWNNWRLREQVLRVGLPPLGAKNQETYQDKRHIPHSTGCRFLVHPTTPVSSHKISLRLWNEPAHTGGTR